MENNCDLVNILSANIGKIVTLFTTSGGESGSGFTGVLVRADVEFCKLVTSPSSAPQNPFDPVLGSFNGNHRGRGCKFVNPIGTIAVIPTDKICCFLFNEV